MKNLEKRIIKLEKRNKPKDFGYNEFVKKCFQFVAMVPRGISHNCGLTPEQEEAERKLFADYPEYAKRYCEWIRELSNRRSKK